MKRILIIIGSALGGLALLTFGMMFFMALSSPQAPAPQSGADIYNQQTVTVSQQQNTPPIQYVATTSRVTTMEVGLTNGKSVVVNDFVHAKTTVTNSDIPNRYFIAGGIDPVGSDQPYSIYYSSVDQSFTIVLLKSPFDVVRDEAELDLVGKLNIDETTACNLRYQVVIPSWQSSQYSGENLGFKGCPNAVTLTQ